MRCIRHNGIDVALFSFVGLVVSVRKLIEGTQRMISRATLRRVVTVLAFAIATSSAMSGENVASVPVGFVRVSVPANDRVLASIPFLPFGNAITNASAGQLVGSADGVRFDGARPKVSSFDLIETMPPLVTPTAGEGAAVVPSARSPALAWGQALI